MIRDEVTITVFEGNDPLVQCHIDSESPEGVVTDYDFTSADEVEFIIKTGVAVSDEDAVVYSITGDQVTVIDPPTGGDLTIQMSGTDLATPGVWRYRIDVTKNSKKETVMLGPFIIQNT